MNLSDSQGHRPVSWEFATFRFSATGLLITSVSTFYYVYSYTPLDWLTSLGFVPPERWAAWQRVDPVLPRVRRDGPFAEESAPTAQVWREQGPALLQHIKHSEL